MAHNINTYVGKDAAWHKLGTVTGKYQTTEELLADPGFQYVVFKSQLRDGLGRPIEAYGTFRWDLKDKLAGNKEATQFLGTVGKDYSVIQHQEGFRSIDALMRTADGAHYETAGVLGNGERVWALANLGLAAKVGDDVQRGYLLFSTGHDGSMAHSYRICMTRVVCQNTLSAALSEKSKAALTIRHTKNAISRLTDARAALDSISEDVVRIEDRLNFLAGRKMNREALTTVLDRLFPKQKNVDSGESRDTTRRTNILSDIVKLYELNDGNAFPEQRGTAYALLNSITNYTDHERSSKDDARAESAMFGSGDTLKSRALEVIYGVSRDLEPVQRIQESVAVDWQDLGMSIAH
jgi:phage/plasmid-like protein (TIGR03299 family)